MYTSEFQNNISFKINPVKITLKQLPITSMQRKNIDRRWYDVVLIVVRALDSCHYPLFYLEKFVRN